MEGAGRTQRVGERELELKAAQGTRLKKITAEMNQNMRCKLVTDSYRRGEDRSGKKGEQEAGREEKDVSQNGDAPAMTERK
jgi:hypothetical protein